MLYKNILLVLLVVAVVYEASAQNVQSFPYIKYTLYSGKYIVQIRMKKMPLVTFIPSLSLNRTFLALTGVSLSEGSFIKNTTLSVSDTETLRVAQMKDEFALGDESNPNNNIHINSTYYIVNNNDDTAKPSETFPLAHLFANYDESFVHQMQMQGMIERAVFALSRRTEFNGKLYFGGIPQEELTHTPFEAKCNANVTDVNWSCRLNAVYFEDKRYKVYVNKHYMRFSSDSYKILVPLDFYEYLKRSVFREHLESKRCIYYSGASGKRYIECDCPTVKSFPRIKFVIDNVVYGVDMEDIFEFFDASQSGFEFCQFEIEVNENGDYFDLGVLFLGFYHTVFDYETNSVTFYSGRPFEFFEEGHLGMMKVCYVVLIGILLIAIVYIIILRQKLK